MVKIIRSNLAEQVQRGLQTGLQFALGAGRLEEERKRTEIANRRQISDERTQDFTRNFNQFNLFSALAGKDAILGDHPEARQFLQALAPNMQIMDNPEFDDVLLNELTESQRLQSEIDAGTRAILKDPDADPALKETLLNSVRFGRAVSTATLQGEATRAQAANEAWENMNPLEKHQATRALNGLPIPVRFRDPRNGQMLLFDSGPELNAFIQFELAMMRSGEGSRTEIEETLGKAAAAGLGSFYPAPLITEFVDTMIDPPVFTNEDGSKSFDIDGYRAVHGNRWDELLGVWQFGAKNAAGAGARAAALAGPKGEQRLQIQASIDDLIKLVGAGEGGAEAVGRLRKKLIQAVGEHGGEQIGISGDTRPPFFTAVGIPIGGRTKFDFDPEVLDASQNANVPIISNPAAAAAFSVTEHGEDPTETFRRFKLSPSDISLANDIIRRVRAEEFVGPVVAPNE